MKRRRRRIRPPEEIRTIVEEFEKSGLTRTAFAKRIDVHVSVLSRWIARQRTEKRQPSKTALVPVRVEPRPVDLASPYGLEVVLTNGRLVRINPGFNEEALGRVVSVLEQC
jgi:transposase-like protein